MKKKIIIILSIFTFNCCSLFHKEIKTDEAFCLNNDHDALIFAEKKLNDFFGDNIKDEKPFDIYLEKDSIWVVSGTLPWGWEGGVANIKINAKNCEIIKVSHGK